MNTVCFLLKDVGDVAKFNIGQIISPDKWFDVIANDKNYQRSRGALWRVTQVHAFGGCVTCEKVEPQGLEAWLPAESPAKGSLIRRAKEYAVPPPEMYSSAFHKLLSKETDAALQKLADEVYKAPYVPYTLSNGMTVIPDPSLPKDTTYVINGDVMQKREGHQMLGGPKHVTVATNEYASVSFDAWEASEKASSEIKRTMPTVKEMSDELMKELRRLHPGVEMMRAKNPRHVYVKNIAGDERCFLRSKVYGKATVSHEAVVAGDIVGEVHGACFETARLLASLIKKQIDTLVPSWHFEHRGVSVRFTGDAVDVLSSYGRPELFAFLDSQSDAVCWRLRSYFTVAPVGEELTSDE